MSSPQTPPHSATPAGVDFGRCFTFVIEDPDWVKKVLIGGLFTLASAVLIGTFFVAGYWSRVVKNVAAGAPRPLPEWDDLGGIFSDGLGIVGLYVVYFLGLGIAVGLLACPFGLIFGGLAGLSHSDAGEAIATAVSGLGFVVFYGLFALLGLLLGILFPAAAVRVVFKGDLTAGFDVGAILGFLRQNLGNYLLSVVVFILASFLAQFGVVLCCVGYFPAAFWAYLSLGYGIGQTVRANPASLG
jgi:hypothetical protein